MNEIAELSTDIHVITAEINAYQRVAGEAIFEIGRRLHEVKYNPIKYGLPSGTDKEGRTIVARGHWGNFLDSINMEHTKAKHFILVFMELNGKRDMCHGKTLRALYEITQIPESERTQPHTIPSTQETKTVDEMTVRELREVKKALKEAEAKASRAESDAEVARRDAEIKARQLARATEPVIKEIEVERIVEVDKTDYNAKRRLEAYEAKFGALENYSERHRATNIEDITTAARSFNLKVRELIKQHAYLLNYPETIVALDARTRSEFDESIRSLASFANDLQGDVGRSCDVFDAEFVNVQ